MKVAKVSAGAGLADPAAGGWKEAPGEAVALSPVPLEAQPNAYIQEAWKDRPYGQTAQAKVAAATDGDTLFVRVEWEDDSRPHGEFQDAAGAVFPLNGDSPLSTMGSADSPVSLWYWQEGRPAALEITSQGPGVFRRQEGGVSAQGSLKDGKWAVVLSGPAKASAGGRLGIAIWNGSNDERAGLAAVSQDWITLES